MPTEFRVQYAFVGDDEPRTFTTTDRSRAELAKQVIETVRYQDLKSISIQEVARLNKKTFSAVELETFRFLCGTKPGRVQAIKLIRFLAQSGLREASDFLNELCPKPERPMVAAHQTGTTPMQHDSREVLIAALVEDVSNTDSLREQVQAMAEKGFVGFAQMTNRELIDDCYSRGLDEQCSSVQNALPFLESEDF